MSVQIAGAVATCALVARERPTLRVCMWTCPTVLLTAHSPVPTLVVGIYRGSEVVLGGLVGGVLRWGAEKIVAVMVRAGEERLCRQ